MATNLALDDRLILEAKRLGGHRARKEAVTAALNDYIKRHKRLGILELEGKIDFHDNFDPKRLRRNKPNRGK
jgi:hypothetical protein